MVTLISAPKARNAATAALASARLSSALVLGATVKHPVLRAVRPVKTVESCYRSGNPSKRIALTATEVAALRLAARVAGLI